MGKFWIAVLLSGFLMTTAASAGEKDGQNKEGLRTAVSVHDANRFCIASQDAHLAPGTHLTVVSPLDKACLADGGVCLSLWSGKPMEGELLWRGFRFVDFDMDAENCTPKDQAK